MKKLVMMFAAVAAISFAATSCGGGQTAATDTVDTAACCDSADYCDSASVAASASDSI